MNVDEGGIMEGKGNDSLVMGTKETKEALVKNGGSRSWVTIIDAITASGKYLDPGVVFKGKELQGQWFLREFKKICDWKYICSENG